MTKSEYQELVEFLAGKFGRIDQRFEQMDQRFEQIDQRFESMEGRLTRVEVFEERNRHLIETVAEGVTGLDRRLESFRAEVSDRFASLEAEMHLGFRSVREELRAALGEQSELFQRSDAELEGRVSSLEVRVDRLEQGSG